jgi:hypothetical protein
VSASVDTCNVKTKQNKTKCIKNVEQRRTKRKTHACTGTARDHHKGRVQPEGASPHGATNKEDSKQQQQAVQKEHDKSKETTGKRRMTWATIPRESV